MNVWRFFACIKMVQINEYAFSIYVYEIRYEHQVAYFCIRIVFIISKLKKINTFEVKLSSTVMKYRQHNNGEKIHDMFRTAPASD